MTRFGRLSQFLTIFTTLLSSGATGLCQFTLVSVGHINDGGVAAGLAVSSNHVYLANQSDGFRIYDVSDPANPVNIAHTNNPGPAEDVVVSGNYAYLANAGDGLRIYDISNPTNPFSVGQVYHSAPALALVLTSNYVYVAAANAVQVFEVSNPAAPYFSAATFASFSSVYGVDVSGGYVYFVDGVNGLYIYAVGDLVRPLSHIVNGSLPYSTWVTVSGKFAYVANGNDGLRVYNVTNALAPINVGHANTGGFAYAVTLAGNYAFVSQSNGIRVYDVTDPSRPIAAGATTTTGQAYNLAVSGDYIYVANATDGLRIFRMLPQLQVAPGPSYTVTLTWPVTVAPFLLEQRSNLTAGSWTVVTNTPTSQGQQNQVVLDRTSGNEFYRLSPN